MGRTLLERLELYRQILHELDIRNLHYSELQTAILRKRGCTYAPFEYALRYLRVKGFVEKASKGYRAPLIITEKGKLLLNLLEMLK